MGRLPHMTTGALGQLPSGGAVDKRHAIVRFWQCQLWCRKWMPTEADHTSFLKCWKERARQQYLTSRRQARRGGLGAKMASGAMQLRRRGAWQVGLSAMSGDRCGMAFAMDVSD